MTKTYTFHPLANEFPLMEGDEFAELVADIKANGQQEPIILFEGVILDGRNRYRACEKLGIEPRIKPLLGVGSYEHARAYVISANAHRRHLAPGEKDRIIAALLLADPTASNRAIADKAGTYHKKVERTRKRMAAAGTLVPPDRSVGLDRKTYPAQAPKPTEKAPATSQAEVSAEERKQQAAAEEPVWHGVDVASYVRLLHMDMKRNGVGVVARELRRASCPAYMARELAKWLGSAAEVMKNMNVRQDVADRAAARAKKPAPAGKSAVKTAADRAEARAKKSNGSRLN